MPYSYFCIVTSHQNLFCSTFVKWLDYKRQIANKIHVYAFLHENIAILCDLWWGMESSQWFQLWFILPAAPCLLMSVAHTGSYWLEISHTDTVLCSCLWSIYPFSLEISNMDTILSRDLGVWNFHPSLQKLGGIIRNTICQTWQHFDWALYGPILCMVRCSAVSLISIQ